LTDAPIPSWARDWLGKAFGGWLEAAETKAPRLPSLDILILGKRGGRHSRAAQSQTDLRNKQLGREAVELAKLCGEGSMFREGFKILETYCRTFLVDNPYGNADSLKSSYYASVEQELPRNPKIEDELRLANDPACAEIIRRLILDAQMKAKAKARSKARGR